MAALRLYQPHLSMAFGGQLEGLLIVALDGNDVRAEGHQLRDLALGGALGNEDVGLEARGRGVARQGATRRCPWTSRR